MTIYSERLLDIIEFAKQTSQLKTTPPQEISNKIFRCFEEKVKGLPGVTVNNSNDDSDEIWLRVERLHESSFPIPKNNLLEVWIDFSNAPQKEPSLKSHVDRQNLINIGAINIALKNKSDVPDTELPIIALEDFEGKDMLQEQIKSYIEIMWQPWIENEKAIQKSISLYAELFMLSQQLQGNLLDSQLELVWGIGIGLWSSPKGVLTYPLITQLVEISIDQQTMALEIRPRRTSLPRLEIDIYSAMDNPGVAKLDAVGKKFFEEIDGTISPFLPSSFEIILRSAASLLDSSGIYWPTKTTSDDRALPKHSQHLIVTDTWVLFARPRTNVQFIQDLERFGNQLTQENPITLTSAILSLVQEPSTTNEEIALPAFRGLSSVGTHHDYEKGKIKELFFPKAYNDEQVQIIQMLEVHDGVVVQGPPGTGKTHTIANVICHYLAQGKRVLVTSMKEPALTVLQEKLPESIRPLAISLLTSEVEGMKQFEFSINKIAAEVTRIDKNTYRQEIGQIDERIEVLHGQISKADKEIANWARKNLDQIMIDDEQILPVDAAHQIASNEQNFQWFPDALGIENRYKPLFDNTDISNLRHARLRLGADLAYFLKKIPQFDQFPETAKILQAHQNLSHLSELKSKELSGMVPVLANMTSETIESIKTTVFDISNFLKLIYEIDGAQQAWTEGIKQYLRRNPQNEILDLFYALKNEIIFLLKSKKQFIAKPVILPENFDLNSELVEAVSNLSQGKQPFGLRGLIGKSEQKRVLDSIVVVSTKPSAAADWDYVLQFIQFQQKSREMLIRWNTLAAEIKLPHIETKPARLIDIELNIELFDKIDCSVTHEKNIAMAIHLLLPTWNEYREKMYDMQFFFEAEYILNHHLTSYRLAETWVVKESLFNAFSGCEESITHQLRDFVNESLGNSEISLEKIQSDWSKLMAELRRIHGLSTELQKIFEITALIEDSGAPYWAVKLRSEPYTGAFDALLPDNWYNIWRLCRLSNFVDSIDCRKELKHFFKLRTELESSLAKAYQESIAKRTWLKLAENATHDVRAALEAYRLAIRKIGKGTGIRAGRFRQDARLAAERANSAIPCWIMPHYRICESLPSNIGDFDLVIIDEASQSDLTALPALLRAKKILVVGDDKQVSPEGIGLEEEKIKALMVRFLAKQVDIYRPQMSPDRSIYDLFKVVFAKSAVMLREHFRCVAPIIEYSKREFYNHELKPLRIPKASERLDPPLIDVYVVDGYRDKDKNVNRPEARFIVDEIKRIVDNPKISDRTIGVVSLLGNKQALLIMQMLNKELGEKIITKNKITCGDARTFQGKERDIMFLSMIVSPGSVHADTKDMMAQRYNVAASRAQNRMYLIRSLQLEDLSLKDELRIKLIQHFQAPFLQNEEELDNLRERCDSDFEKEVFDLLVERGYRVIPQVPVGSYRIDMVVEGDNDSRLAIECDGDRYHGPEKWEHDMRRQRILERAGWHFWRCFASTFMLHREDVLRDLLETLNARGIHPSNIDSPVTSIHVEFRQVVAFPAIATESVSLECVENDFYADAQS